MNQQNLKNISEALITVTPSAARPRLRELIKMARRQYLRTNAVARYRGNRVECPVCQWHGREFLPNGLKQRTNAICPRCGALERHRLLYLYLKDRTDVFVTQMRLLHFAPEPALSRILAASPNIDYITTDLYDPTVMVRTDITDMLFKDNFFDFILCSHVLEHIPDDRRAVQELRRVLRAGGTAIVQVPLQESPEAPTLEDPAVTTPEERQRVFGQRDHVRIYGYDVANRLMDAGFEVNVVTYARELGEAATTRYGLVENDPIFHLT